MEAVNLNKELYIEYTVKNEQYVTISAASHILGRTVNSIRRLVLQGNSIRRMKALRDGSKFLIPVKEIYGFPFLAPGHNNTDLIYHFDKETESFVTCDVCSYTPEFCSYRFEAESLKIEG